MKQGLESSFGKWKYIAFQSVSLERQSSHFSRGLPEDLCTYNMLSGQTFPSSPHPLYVFSCSLTDTPSPRKIAAVPTHNSSSPHICDSGNMFTCIKHRPAPSTHSMEYNIYKHSASTLPPPPLDQTIQALLVEWRTCSKSWYCNSLGRFRWTKGGLFFNSFS